MSSLEALLAAGRAAHEAIMIDTVTLQRPGPDIYNPVAGDTTQPDALTLYTGPARVKPVVAVAETAQVGDRAVVLRRYEVALPWSATPAGVDRVVPGAGDQVHVTASPNPRLVGMTLWVVSVGESATATAWRLITEDRS